jgi:hypothetical protein
MGMELGSIVRAMAEWGIEHRLDDEQRAAAVAIMGRAKRR